jgi:hypothetical protein
VRRRAALATGTAIDPVDRTQPLDLPLWTGTSIDHGTFTEGNGAVGSSAMRRGGDEATAQMVSIVAMTIVIPRIRKWIKKSPASALGA